MICYDKGMDVMECLLKKYIYPRSYNATYSTLDDVKYACYVLEQY